DGSISGNWHFARIAFVSVSGEVDVHKALRAVHRNVRNSVSARAEVGMQADGRTDSADDRGGVGINRRTGNVLVPGIVRGEGQKSVEVRARAQAHYVAGQSAAAGSATAT